MTKAILPIEAEDTRGRILKAAFEEFHRNGFQGGSLNHIVEAAGATKGALFHHFTGKNDLGHAVIEEVIRPYMKARWFDALASSIDPVTDLKRTMKSFAHEEIAKSATVNGCPLNNLAQEMSPLDEEFRQQIERIYTEWRGCLESAFARGIKAGKIRKNISPRNVAALVVAALEGMIGTAKNAQSAEPLMHAGAAFFDYLDSLKP
jgi:AcrR family transcriptional regulator